MVRVKDKGRCGSLGPFVMATVRREVVAGRSDQALATPDHREGEAIQHWKVPLSTLSYTQDTELHTSREQKHVGYTADFFNGQGRKHINKKRNKQKTKISTHTHTHKKKRRGRMEVRKDPPPHTHTHRHNNKSAVN